MAASRSGMSCESDGEMATAIFMRSSDLWSPGTAPDTRGPETSGTRLGDGGNFDGSRRGRGTFFTVTAGYGRRLSVRCVSVSIGSAISARCPRVHNIIVRVSCVYRRGYFFSSSPPPSSVSSVIVVFRLHLNPARPNGVFPVGKYSRHRYRPEEYLPIRFFYR